MAVETYPRVARFANPVSQSQ
ncbi:unnamed protein product [Fusarium graminearum]|nr:hypothetical protein FG05_35391 [Fusarium graminearum]CZS76436.1 unnamed protein product [Fusarium graminearum]